MSDMYLTKINENLKRIIWLLERQQCNCHVLASKTYSWICPIHGTVKREDYLRNENPDH